MKKLVLLILVILSFQNNRAQKVLNNYKYVIVPKRFDFQKKDNSYRINSLTKYLLSQHNFNTLLDGQDMPEDVFKNRCLALKVKMPVKSTMFRTNLWIAFVNCRNEVVYKTVVGTSREKDYQKSYTEAIRGAFKSFENYKYTYQPQTDAIVKVKDVAKPRIKRKILTTQNELKHKPLIKKVNNKAPLPVVAKSKIKTNKALHISGLYLFDKEIYEIAKFQNYYIFSKHSDQGKVYKTVPLGFIYKTSKKGTYLVKTNDTFTGYLLENGNFVLDVISKNGTIKSKVFVKKDN